MNITPMGFNVVVKPDPIEEVTAGGIIMPNETQDADTRTQTRGTLVAVSPMAFSWPDWPKDEPTPQPGAKVVYARYSGASSKVMDGEEELIVIKDEDIVAVVQ